LNCVDTRNTNPEPQEYEPSMQLDFKFNTTDGLSDGGTYHGVLTIRPYGSFASDFSGGPAFQVAFTNNGNMWIRKSLTAASWGDWLRIPQLGETSTTAYRGDRGKTAYDYSQVGHLPLSGGSLTGKLNIKSDTSQAMLNLPRIGTANPTSTVSGDVWYRSNNIYYNDQGTVRVVAHTGSWSTVSQAEAEAGTATSQRLWTAERVKQAILALSPGQNVPAMVYDDNGVEKAITKITFSADGIKLTVAD
jgi:hypothetical protein